MRNRTSPFGSILFVRLSLFIRRLLHWLVLTDDLGVDNESKCPVSGKRKYASEGEALATAAHQIATTKAPKELSAYLCSWCDAWHLTKNEGRVGKDRK
jgi:hypothetical protein